MTNPNEVPELCECGHEETDHLTYDVLDPAQQGLGLPMESICTVRDRRNHLCECKAFKPRDEYWHAGRAEDAAVARWEESVGR